MRRLKPGFSITRVALLALLACAARVALCQGETITFTLPGDVPLEMVRIPAGSFEMGSNDDSSWSWCFPCEQPVHTVSINYNFYMGKYEVTQAQWEAVMGSNPWA